MKKRKTKPKITAPVLTCILLACMSGVSLAQDAEFLYFQRWRTVANNNDVLPGGSANFNSYNQPSINTKGLVVFRARSKGPDVMSGIYTRDMVTDTGSTVRIADRTTPVPEPNNTFYAPDDTLAAFNEFPSIPRIAPNTATIATRGNSQPTWTYLLEDLTESKAGTTGIFTNPRGQLITGASLLGAVPEPADAEIGTNYFPYFQVPGAIAGTKFDVFPGSPSVTDDDIIAFKGNYTEDTIGKTGVFFRDLVGSGGLAPVELVANSNTVIPNGPGDVLFGSTAPPSAAAGQMVFVGSDNEDNPTYGGIYMAPLEPAPFLTTLVGVGDQVPHVPTETFTKFGEALSFDGRYVAFWATWGSETKQLILDCSEDGNADRIAYCTETYPNGFLVEVPVHQGIFVIDTMTGALTLVAETGEDFDDFLFWNFSGHPPGVGGGDEGDGELPRWRSSAFVSVSSAHISGVETLFKARKGEIVDQRYASPVDGIYWSRESGGVVSVSTLVDTLTPGQAIDPEAPAESTVSALSMEREAFRGQWAAISVTMLEPISGESMAGVYVSGVGPWVDTITDTWSYYYKLASDYYTYYAGIGDYATASAYYYYYLAAGDYNYYSAYGYQAVALYYYYVYLGYSYYYFWYPEYIASGTAIGFYYAYMCYAYAFYYYYLTLGDVANAQYYFNVYYGIALAFL